MPPGIGLDWRWMLNGSKRSTQVCIQSLAIIQQSRRMKSGSSEYSVLQRAEGEISTENTPNYTLKMVLKGCFVSNVIIILFTYSWIGYFQELCVSVWNSLSLPNSCHHKVLQDQEQNSLLLGIKTKVDWRRHHYQHWGTSIQKRLSLIALVPIS